MNDTSPKQSPSGASLPRNVKVLGWASFLNDVSSEMIFPLLPQFLLTMLGGNRFYLGMIEGVAESVSSLLKLWSGAWSDRIANRKGLVVFGYTVAAVSRPMVGLITAPWQLFVVRTMDRAGKGIRSSPRDAMIADSMASGSRGRAFGFHRAMDHLGAAVGPLLATAYFWFFPGELRQLFLLTLVPGLLVVVLLIRGLRDSVTSHAKQQQLSRTFTPIDRNMRRYLLALLIFTLGNSSDAFLLVRSSELGVPTVQLPLLWLAFHIVKSAGNLLVGKLVDRIGPRLPLFCGWLIYAGTYLAFALATAAWQAWAFFLIYAAFYAFTEPAEKTLIAHLAGPEQQGLAFGWYHFTIGITALPSSLIFGALYEAFGPVVAFGWGASLAAGSMVLLSGVRTIRENADSGLE